MQKEISLREVFKHCIQHQNSVVVCIISPKDFSNNYDVHLIYFYMHNNCMYSIDKETEKASLIVSTFMYKNCVYVHIFFYNTYFT